MHPLTNVWWELFVNRTDGALRWRGRSWVYDPEPLTPEAVSRSLSGTPSLGVYATDEAGLAKWLCLDADTDVGAHALIELATTFESGSYLFEPSRRGAHLWRFCPPTPWHQVRAVGEHLSEVVNAQCEVFPKGSGRTGVRLPMTIHPKAGQRYAPVDPSTGEILSLDTLRRLQATPLPRAPLTRRVPPPLLVGERGDFATLFREIDAVSRLRQYGPERAIGRCPFHDDRHPSLSLLGGFWRCWAGCGEGGVIAFRSRLQKAQ
jgi:hypothetical protein